MFEGVTKYIPDLEEKKDPHRTISKIEDAVYSFVHNNPKWGLKYYRDILKSRGVDIEKTPMSEVDAASLGWLRNAERDLRGRRPAEMAAAAQEVR